MCSFESSVSAISNASDWCYSHSGEWKGMMTSSNGNIFRVSGPLWRETSSNHRSQVDSPHKGQWRGALIFSSTISWANNLDAGDLRRHRAHFDVTVVVGNVVGLGFNMIDYTFHTRMLLLLRCVKSVESDERPTDSFLSGSKTKGTALILRSRALSLVAWVAI